MLEHDYVRFPELTTKQLQEFGLTSPHVQIVEDFFATVVKVHDGDTVTLRVKFRDFDFPLRLLEVDAPEMNSGGEVARDWLRGRILEKEVMVMIDRENRVGKYGRLLGRILHSGMDAGQEMLYLGLVKPFGARSEGQLPIMEKELSVSQWL